ncbi:hypothetical protein HO151_05285, partial [Streptomyces sp. 8P21H-1]|nr:hypothetical protein [Streptomyces sp. 8P21H-1]
MTWSPMPPSSRPPQPLQPNLAFRRLRGRRSPGEFAAAVRRAAREIDEQVSCDARYIGRVEAGEIRCPNYAYERVFLHMFPGRTLTDLGFVPRSAVRGRGARAAEQAPAAHTESPPRTPPETDGSHAPDAATHCTHDPHALHDAHDTCAAYDAQDPYDPHAPQHPHAPQDPSDPRDPRGSDDQSHEESDVRRRAFMSGGTAAVAAASLGPWGPAFRGTAEAAPRSAHRKGGAGPEAGALEETVRRIRLLDDRHGADGL